MNINPNTILLIFIILAIFVSSCTQNEFQIADTGYQYKFIRRGDGPEFKNNHYLMMNMDYYYEDDSLLFAYTDKNVPVSMQYIDTLWDLSGQIYRGLKRMKVGDSAIFIVNCANLYEVSFHTDIPYGLNPNSDITFYVGVSGMLSPEEFRLWQANLIVDRQEAIKRKREQQFFEDISLIDLYMESSGIIPMELESGIRFFKIREGNGIKPEKGDRVVIHYTGYLLDGSKFHSSYDNQEPFEYTFGVGNVIQGWDKGVAQMSVGSKYTFYLPSTLAYGEQGMGEMVGPNTVVVFDIELLDIKKKGK
jgi:FKBP-type peptidyl-prolyl cis-trans isomerase